MKGDLRKKKDRQAFAEFLNKPFQMELEPNLKPYQFRFTPGGCVIYVGVKTAKLVLEYAKVTGNRPRPAKPNSLN